MTYSKLSEFVMKVQARLITSRSFLFRAASLIFNAKINKLVGKVTFVIFFDRRIGNSELQVSIDHVH